MPNTRPGRLGGRLEPFEIINIAFLLVLALLVAYPFYNAILISIVPDYILAKNPAMLIPPEISFDAYEYMINSGALGKGYLNTGFILLFGLPVNLLLTVSMGYVFSRNAFPGKRLFVFLVLFTMFFSGGIIPLYLVITRLKLINTRWSVILSGAVNTFNMILVRSYFETIPDSLEESAKIDGASDIVILARIYLPLATPILATIFLFYAVDRWNEWFGSMLFIRDSKLIPLSLVMRNIVYSTYEVNQGGLAPSELATKNIQGNAIKMASIVLTMAPVMLLYPFVQRFFITGITLGAVKS